MIKIKLVDDARRRLKTWSVRFGIVGTAISGALFAFPSVVLDLWNQAPPEIKELLPRQWVALIPMILFVLSTGARFIKQEKLEKTDGE